MTKAQTETAVTTQAETAVAVAEPTFNLPILVNPAEIMEIVRENMGDTDNMRFDRVKIPSGGGLAFEVPGEGEEPEILQDITGIVLDHYKVNAYWVDRFTGANNPPDCSSLDGIAGEGNPGGNCANCPLNQWGSATDDKGVATKGKACKNIRRVYILREGEVFPLMLALPPTSLANFNDYMKRISSRNPIPYYGCITRVKLSKAQNAGGIWYSKATFSRVETLKPEERAAMRKYAVSLKNAMRSVKVDAGEYEVGAEAEGMAQAAAGGEDQPW